jgi:hypothetical protein
MCLPVAIVRTMDRFLCCLTAALLLTACTLQDILAPSDDPSGLPARYPTGTPLSPSTIIIPETGAGTPTASLIVPTQELTLVLPTLTAYPDDHRFSLGQSVEGRDIWAWQFGEGPYTIVLVGGIHGGFEANTVVLAEELVNYFRSTPSDVLIGVRLVIIPAANPDGLLRGSGIEGRFNANGIDLNRNWGCEWSPTAVLQDVPVNPGPRPFSEPESLALRSYFSAEPPDAVVFYHSAAGGIFLGQCLDKPAARWLGTLLENATGYPHRDTFSYYEVSGDASNWLAERGIPAAVVETYSKDDSEFDLNFPGVMALQCHFALLYQSENGATPDPAYLNRCED